MMYNAWQLVDSLGRPPRELHFNSGTFSHREAVITLLQEVLFSRCTKLVIAQQLCTQTKKTLLLNFENDLQL